MYDYHTHSDFSDDCQTPIEQMVEGAIRKGIMEIAITDHFDPDYPDPDFPFLVDFPAYHQKLPEIQARYKDSIKVRKGVEIGIQDGKTIEACEAAAKAFPYDFIIGSFHCAWGQDIYGPYFTHRSPEEGLRDFYLYMDTCLHKFMNFDVLGHFNVIDRYAAYIPDYAPFMEIIEVILKRLIENGKGLEMNTSSFRYGMGNRMTPAEEILSLYRELGGEIITIGSDAHKAEDLCFRYDYAKEVLISHGFRYLSTFEDRQVSFVKL